MGAQSMTTSTRENDLFRMLCGDEISRGSSRCVYRHASDPTLVVKEEESGFQNIMEWLTWERIQPTSWAKWFAPCMQISNNGLFLVMKKTLDLDLNKLPERMPKFLSDFKYQNYGILDGKVVCRDYGTNLLMEYGMSNVMKKVKWWDGANYR